MHLAAGNAPHPVMKEQFNDLLSPLLHLMLPILLFFLVVMFFFTMGTKLFRGSSSTTYIERTSRPYMPPPPPPNPMPPEVRQLAEQLKAAAEKVKSPVDQHNLRKICTTIPVFYKRYKELGGDSTYTAPLEQNLPDLVDAMATYLQIQANPAMYTFGGPGDQLYLGITRPKKRLQMISQAIQNYLDMLYAAMRDDNKLEVATLDLKLGTLLAGGMSQKGIALRPLQQKAATLATGLYGKAKAQIGK